MSTDLRTPETDILGSTIDPDVKVLLGKYGAGIDKLLSFGSKTLIWDLDKQRGPESLLVPILFLRNYIELLDSIGVLVRASSIDPAKSLLRTALESFFAMEYLLAENQEQRANSFIVWNTYQNIAWYRKLDGNSETFKQLKATFAVDTFLKNSEPMILEKASALLANSQQILAMPQYIETNKEFIRTKEKLKSSPNWYSLFDGPRDVEGLARHTKYPALYEVLYRSLSNAVHGTDIIQGKLLKGEHGEPQIPQIRLPRSAQMVTQYCFSISIATYKTYILSRLKEKHSDYTNWYLSIQDYFNKLLEGQHITIV